MFHVTYRRVRYRPTEDGRKVSSTHSYRKPSRKFRTKHRNGGRSQWHLFPTYPLTLHSEVEHFRRVGSLWMQLQHLYLTFYYPVNLDTVSRCSRKRKSNVTSAYRVPSAIIPLRLTFSSFLHNSCIGYESTVHSQAFDWKNWYSFFFSDLFLEIYRNVSSKFWMKLVS